MASWTRWTWVWVNSGRWWWTGRPGVLRFMGSQSQKRLSDWTALNWDCLAARESFLQCNVIKEVTFAIFYLLEESQVLSHTMERDCKRTWALTVGSLEVVLESVWASLVAQLVKNLPVVQETWIPLQFSGLENSIDCIVHGVTKSRTRLSNFHFTFRVHPPYFGEDSLSLVWITNQMKVIKTMVVSKLTGLQSTGS